ncbi:TPA: hypothetical protein ACYHN4_000378 [Vibrio cholerae]|uniref:hypothetical protein n=1 Tax=Vibrio cholerae TaxID=666 RepID=UPI000E67FC5A|nr:hypothetical protein [Vibrio cholerae]
MNKIIVALCEGAHDIAFINRVLIINGFNDYNKELKLFLEPFGKKFINVLSNIQIEERKLGYQGPSFELPSAALKKNNTLVFIHNMGGDGAKKNRKILLDSYLKLVDAGGEQDDFSEYNFQYRFIYFFDADDVGVDGRLQAISQEIGLNKNMTNGILYKNNGIEYGAYIFHDMVTKLGTLEDTITKIVCDNNGEAIIRDANNFLDQNQLPESRQKEIRYNNGLAEYRGTSKFSVKKSILNMVCQLQFSGMNNAAFIRSSDFISDNHVTNCEQCRLICSLFKE